MIRKIPYVDLRPTFTYGCIQAYILTCTHLPIHYISHVIERFIVRCWLTHKETENPTICPLGRLVWSPRPKEQKADVDQSESKERESGVLRVGRGGSSSTTPAAQSFTCFTLLVQC